MRRVLLAVFALLFSTGALAWAMPASAQATRTWVSGVGDDANPCSRTAPCKTFAGAISKTAAQGEINCIDPGGFGAVTITKSITINCSIVEGGVLVSGTNGIVVNALSTDRVVLKGLDIQGVGTGLNGITIVGSGTVFIEDCLIEGFTQNAVNVAGTSGARAFVENSQLIYNNGGVSVAGQSGASNVGFINHVTMDRNATFSVKVASASSVVLTDSVLAGSTTGLDIAAGATLTSYGNNVIRDPGTPTSTLPTK